MNNLFSRYTKSIVPNDSFYKVSYLSLVYMSKSTFIILRIESILYFVNTKHSHSINTSHKISFYFSTISRRFTLTLPVSFI
nr:MAG TPA: hypothetical protein [Caudoviricetes sp.]